jgi:hypothetical protein
MRRILLTLFAGVPFALAGPVSFGIKGGVPFSDAFDAAKSGQLSFLTNNHHWTLGPELDLNLPLGFAIEVDALYRRVNYSSTVNLVAGSVTDSRTTANSWDFPLLLKWRSAPGPIRPYVSVGPTFNGLTNLNQVTTFFGPSAPNQGSTTSNPPELKRQFNTGFTLGGGVQILGHISPEVRYTRWGWDSVRDISGLLKTNPNQLQFLVGITF